jgi:hypothetical protein
VALRRAGYLEQKQTIGLDPGGEGHLRFVIQADSAAPERESGTLALTISEPNSLVSINGVPQGMSPASLRLPLGRHRLSVKSAGFLDYERDVVVAPAGTSTHIDLMPTSEFLKDYERGARTTRTWGWVSVGSGAVLIGGSVGFLVWNQAEKDTARDNFDEFSSEVRAGPSGMCDDASCEDRLRLLSDRLSEAENRDVFGWVGVSAGAAVAALGAGLLMWGDHPGRYAPSETSDVFQSARIELGPGQARVSGRF